MTGPFYDGILGYMNNATRGRPMDSRQARNTEAEGNKCDNEMPKNKNLNKNNRVPRKKQWVVKMIQRKLVDNEKINLKGLIEIGLGEHYQN